MHYENGKREAAGFARRTHECGLCGTTGDGRVVLGWDSGTDEEMGEEFDICPECAREAALYHAVLIAFDETEFWNLDKLPHAHLIEKIVGVYMFDDGVRHYCCSATPMVWLDGLRNVALVSDDATDAQREEIWEAVEFVVADDPGHYRRASEVEKYREENPDMTTGPQEFEDLDDARDWHQGNHELF